WLLESQPQTESLNGIGCQRLGFVRVPGLASATYVLNAAWFLLRHGRRYDVIHVHMVEKFALALALVKPFVRARVLAKVAGATEFDGGGVFDARNTGWRAALKRRLTLNIGVFQAISQDTVARLTALGLPAERILALPNAIDLDRFTPSAALHGGSEQGPMVVAFTGRLVKEKSLPDLVRAAAILRERGVTDIEFRLAGDGPLRGELEALVAQCQVQDTVHFLGEIDGVDRFLAEAHVYCQVSYIEGLSNSVLEAMASALPCVLSLIQGNADLLRDGSNGLGVPVGDPEAIADALQRLQADRDWCREMGDAARRGVEARFGVERVVSAIERCYRGESLAPALESS
ncbi:MAG: glycosyltransferase, partial [Pseudomonadota bacterium]